jgi:hypothetical protein
MPGETFHPDDQPRDKDNTSHGSHEEPHAEVPSWQREGGEHPAITEDQARQLREEAGLTGESNLYPLSGEKSSQLGGESTEAVGELAVGNAAESESGPQNQEKQGSVEDLERELSEERRLWVKGRKRERLLEQMLADGFKELEDALSSYTPGEELADKVESPISQLKSAAENALKGAKEEVMRSADKIMRLEEAIEKLTGGEEFDGGKVHLMTVKSIEELRAAAEAEESSAE